MFIPAVFILKAVLGITRVIWAQPVAVEYTFAAQKEIIERVAQKGPCVIVGRCADIITRSVADC